MAEEPKSHQTTTEMVKSAPAEVDAATEVVLKVKVTCTSGCDLAGKTIQVLGQDETVLCVTALASSEGKNGETEEFKIKAPAAIGACTWRVVFPAQDIEEVLHESSSASVQFQVKPHTTSMAAWDYASPAIMGQPFSVKIGVSCSGQCQLTGETVEVRDEKGEKLAAASLGDSPWPQTTGLYWAEVPLTAPPAETVYTWTARFGAAGLKLPHQDASTSFVFRTAKPPDHVVTVQVFDKESSAPIKGADVVLFPYRGTTDEAGVANVAVPKGDYEAYVSKPGYQSYQTNIKVDSDQSIKAELPVEIAMY